MECQGEKKTFRLVRKFQNSFFLLYYPPRSIAMANVFRSLVILPLLFVASYAQFWLRPDAYEFFNKKKILGPHELFNNPFGDAQDYLRKKIDNDFGTQPLPKSANPSHPSFFGLPNEPKGSWELVSVNSGVSAMHAILLPKVDKVLMYDATIWKKSEIRLPAGHCRLLNKTTGEKDCFCHSVLFDIATTAITPLQVFILINRLMLASVCARVY
jgi:hypothetical protein